MDLRCPLAAGHRSGCGRKRIYDSNVTKHKVWNRGVEGFAWIVISVIRPNQTVKLNSWDILSTTAQSVSISLEK